MLVDPTMEGVRTIRRAHGYSRFDVCQDEHNTDRDWVLEREQFRGKAIRGEREMFGGETITVFLNFVVLLKRKEEEEKSVGTQRHCVSSAAARRHS
jgi:hypothetical protein